MKDLNLVKIGFTCTLFIVEGYQDFQKFQFQASQYLHIGYETWG